MADFTINPGTSVTLLTNANANGSSTDVAVWSGQVVGKIAANGTFNGANVSIETQVSSGLGYIEADDTRMNGAGQIAVYLAPGERIRGKVTNVANNANVSITLVIAG
jgi:hypothetical protein